LCLSSGHRQCEVVLSLGESASPPVECELLTLRHRIYHLQGPLGAWKSTQSSTWRPHPVRGQAGTRQAAAGLDRPTVVFVPWSACHSLFVALHCTARGQRDGPKVVATSGQDVCAAKDVINVRSARAEQDCSSQPVCAVRPRAFVCTLQVGKNTFSP
jgi:hypothetical protein